MAPSKDTVQRLEKRMESLGIFEEDLVEKFILGSGKGGQKVNKTSSCVYLKHLPSKFEIKCQGERSRELNRYRARQMLCDKIEENKFLEKSKKQKLNDKIRRQKKRRSRKVQAKVREEKTQRSQNKQFRKKPNESS